MFSPRDTAGAAADSTSLKYRDSRGMDDFDDDDDYDEKEAAEAYAAITAQLQQITSTKLGAISQDENWQQRDRNYNAGFRDVNPYYGSVDRPMYGDDDDDDDDDNYGGYHGESGGGGDYGTRPPSYEVDAMEWMEQELREQPLKAATPSPKRTPLLERAGTPVMSNSSAKKEKKPYKSVFGNEYDDDDDNVDMNDADYDTGYQKADKTYDPVQTPARLSPTMGSTPQSSRSRQHTPSPRRKLGMPMTLTQYHHRASFSAGSTSHHYVYRRYHDALWKFLQSKRSLSQRMDLERQELELRRSGGGGDGGGGGGGGGGGDTHMGTSSLPEQECQAELEYLNSLNQICWAFSAATAGSTPERNTSSIFSSEGNLWLLLSILRQLGLSALIWNDDSVSTAQNGRAQTEYMKQLATQVESTPRQLVEELSSPNSPLSLQRRHSTLQWIQTCMDRVRIEFKLPPSSTKSTMTSKTHPDDPRIPGLIGASPHHKDFLKSCLSHIQAGRLDDAKTMARAHGQSWRAATWSGGDPAGLERRLNDQTKSVDMVPVGNPNRFLWKRQSWKNGQRLLAFSRHEESAIYSILANDIQTAMSNPIIRSSRDQTLFVLLHGAWSRIEDEILHWHNNHRRKCRPAYPGTTGPNVAEQEAAQLLATSTLAGITETDILQILSSSPYPAVRNAFVCEQAIAAFLIGKSAVLGFCGMETAALLRMDERNNDDDNIMEQIDRDDADDDKEDFVGRLRFVTHLLLYLDSLQDSATPMYLEGLTDEKNQVLFQYVRYLESRPDQWNLLALYVSLLPEEQIMEYYPEVLVRVLDESERKSMLEQIRELLPTMEIHLLRHVVRLSLSTTGAGRSDSTTPTVVLNDEEKSKSLQWLLQYEEHYGDALICSNILLRELFMNEDDEKMEVSMILVKEHLPAHLLDVAGEKPPSLDTLDVNIYSAMVDNAQAEHMAFLKYLDAYRTFGEWRSILQSTPTSITIERHSFAADRQAPGGAGGGGGGGHAIDYTFLNATEISIAKERQLKNWIRKKRMACQTVLQIAEKARIVLEKVLTHPGGWLSTDDEQHLLSMDDDTLLNEAEKEEQRRRLDDLSEIRARYLILAANLYHQVCEETASWMARSLDDSGGGGLGNSSSDNKKNDDAALPVADENDDRTKKAFYFLIKKNMKGTTDHIDDDGMTNDDDESRYYLPSYWYQHALDLATLVANDTHGISSVFGPNELQEFLSKLAETAVSQLMNP